MKKADWWESVLADIRRNPSSLEDAKAIFEGLMVKSSRIPAGYLGEQSSGFTLKQLQDAAKRIIGGRWKDERVYPERFGRREEPLLA